MKKKQLGLRVSETLNQKITGEAKKMEISKNDYILLAIQEKIKRDIRRYCIFKRRILSGSGRQYKNMSLFFT